MKTNVITIDCGTSFLKAAIFKDDSEQIMESMQIETKDLLIEGKFKKIEGTLVAVQKILKKFTKYGKDFILSISTEMHGFVLTDDSNNLICDYFSWQDELALQTKDNQSYLNFLNEKIIMSDIMKSGMKCKAGIASTNLYVWLDKNLDWKEKKIYFYTLGDYIIKSLSNRQPYIHPTNAAATGLYDLCNCNWNKELIKFYGFENVQFPKVSENQEIVCAIKDTRYKIYPAIGDQQATLYGSGLERNGQLSFNLGTGSQVSVLSKSLDFSLKYQIRPFFHGYNLITIPHIPCGRALNVYFGFIENILKTYNSELLIDKNKIWQILTNCSPDKESENLSINMSFFDNSSNSYVGGSIGNILENNFDMNHLSDGIMKQMVQNYREAVKNLPIEFFDMLVFSGGVSQKVPALRNQIASEFRCDNILVAQNETFLGLLKYVKNNIL